LNKKCHCKMKEGKGRGLAYLWSFEKFVVGKECGGQKKERDRASGGKERRRKRRSYVMGTRKAQLCHVLAGAKRTEENRCKRIGCKKDPREKTRLK